MDIFAAQCNLAFDQKIGVAQIGTEYRVVVLCHGTEEQRPRVLEQQLKLRQHARIAVIKTLGVAGLAANVAAVVEHGKRVGVFQSARAPLLQSGADRDGEIRSGYIIDGVGG